MHYTLLTWAQPSAPSNFPAPVGDSVMDIPLPPIGRAQCRGRPVGGSGGRDILASWIWRFHFNMAEASNSSVGSGCEEKGREGPSPEAVSPDATISRVKLLDTTVDTFLQKLVAAGR